MFFRPAPDTHTIRLGDGRFSVASSATPDGHPALTVRRLDEPTPVGTLLKPSAVTAKNREIVIVVPDRASADVLLQVATHIAAKFGIGAAR